MIWPPRADDWSAALTADRMSAKSTYSQRLISSSRFLGMPLATRTRSVATADADRGAPNGAWNRRAASPPSVDDAAASKGFSPRPPAARR